MRFTHSFEAPSSFLAVGSALTVWALIANRMNQSGKGQLNNPVDLDTLQPAEKNSADCDLLNYAAKPSIS